MEIKVLLREGGQMPTKAYPGDVGWDLYVAKDIRIPWGRTHDVDCGINIELPPGYWGRIVGRSSTIRKKELLVVEGIIDNGYRGPIFTAVHNPNQERGSFAWVRKGDRLAQIIIHKLEEVSLVEATSLTGSPRGAQGFGSSGI